MPLSKSAKYFRSHPEARKKKQAATAILNKKPSAVKKRVECNKARKVAKAAGKDIKGKQYDHAVNKFVTARANMGRAGEGGRKKTARKKK